MPVPVPAVPAVPVTVPVPVPVPEPVPVPVHVEAEAAEEEGGAHDVVADARPGSRWDCERLVEVVVVDGPYPVAVVFRPALQILEAITMVTVTTVITPVTTVTTVTTTSMGLVCGVREDTVRGIACGYV